MLKLHYFNGKLSQGFVALFSGRMIQFVASGLTGLFVPIFILTELNFSITWVLVYYIIGHLAYGLFLPWSSRYLNALGMRRALRISIFFEAAYYLSLFLVKFNPVIFLSFSLFFLTVNRILFWLPYHVDFAKFTDTSNRCKEVSILWATKTLLSIVIPAVSGLLIAFYGFNIVFIFSVIMVLASGIPYLALPRTKERFEWSYLETVKNFFGKRDRKLVVSNLANGAENGVAVVIWPIFIWQILDGNYAAVGVLSSFIVFVTVILQLAVGKYADLFSKRKLMHWGSFFYATGWIAKIFVLTAFQTFFVGAYHSFAQIFTDTPFDVLNYELLAEHGHLVDEYTVLKEMAVQFGKVIIFVFAIIVSFYFGINWTFALAALASLMINIL